MGIDPCSALQRIGQLWDRLIPLGEAALLLASLDHPDVDLAPYYAHFNELAHDTAVKLGSQRQPKAVVAALSDVIANKHGYFGDTVAYDDLQNADLIRVMDRRRGLPVALGILYLETATRLRVPACGLNAPGHFVISVGSGQEAIVADPFNGGVVLGPSLGDTGEGLSPVNRRDILLRLINNLRSRSRDPERILALNERMVMLAPQRADLWLEMARASETVGKLRNAIGALEICITRAEGAAPLVQEAQLAMMEIKRRLN